MLVVIVLWFLLVLSTVLVLNSIIVLYFLLQLLFLFRICCILFFFELFWNAFLESRFVGNNLYTFQVEIRYAYTLCSKSNLWNYIRYIVIFRNWLCNNHVSTTLVCNLIVNGDLHWLWYSKWRNIIIKPTPNKTKKGQIHLESLALYPISNSKKLSSSGTFLQLSNNINFFIRWSQELFNYVIFLCPWRILLELNKVKMNILSQKKMTNAYGNFD